MQAESPPDSTVPSCDIVELRRYTLHPGQREALITLFDREFVETQEAADMTVMGQFRDMDDADQFVWMRGFADMATRRSALTRFYDGPVWQAHRAAANATMVDSSNVLLLSPAWPGAGIAVRPQLRTAPLQTRQPVGMLDVSIFPLRQQSASEDLLALCRHTLSPLLEQAGARTTAWYVSVSEPNNFPRLPVREGEPVLVGLAMFDDVVAFDAFVRSGLWQREAQPLLDPWLARPAQTLRLAPTSRSAIQA